MKRWKGIVVSENIAEITIVSGSGAIRPGPSSNVGVLALTLTGMIGASKIYPKVHVKITGCRRAAPDTSKQWTKND